MTIAEFIAARVDETESDALAAKNELSGVWTYVETRGGDHKVVDSLGYSVSGHYDVEGEPWWTGPHVARHDPARVLREVAALRAILRSYETASRYAREFEGDAVIEAAQSALLGVLCNLAAIWSDHPDYDQEWKP